MLGVLMIIAIPAVTEYINNSRKSSYISSAKNIISGARNLVNQGTLGIYDTSATYYIPATYIDTENGTRSPYGDFTQAYIGVIYDGRGYKYYWISNDSTGQGIKNITSLDKLDNDLIESDIKDIDVRTTVETTGILGRSKIYILGADGKWEDERGAIAFVDGNGTSSGGSSSANDLIPTCPGCVFAFYEEATYTVWNTRGYTPTVFNESNYRTDYRDVLEENAAYFEGDARFFLGFVLNDQKQATKAYACGIKDGTPFCLEGALNGAKHDANQSIIDSLFDSNVPYVPMYTENDNTVMIGDRQTDWFCAVFDGGMFYCGM